MPRLHLIPMLRRIKKRMTPRLPLTPRPTPKKQDPTTQRRQSESTRHLEIQRHGIEILGICARGVVE